MIILDFFLLLLNIHVSLTLFLIVLADVRYSSWAAVLCLKGKL